MSHWVVYPDRDRKNSPDTDGWGWARFGPEKWWPILDRGVEPTIEKALKKAKNV